MSRPKLLDLFACEGGASVGYARAGFDVLAVDMDANRLKRNPHAWLVGDAFAVRHRGPSSSPPSVTRSRQRAAPTTADVQAGLIATREADQKRRETEALRRWTR